MMNLQLSQAEAAAELLTRRKSRQTLLDFTTYTKRDYEVNWHHRVLCDYLDRFIAGEIMNLMVFMPPRSGKSELVSRRLPAFILGQNPNDKVIATSYSADLASRMNRDVQRIIDSKEYNALFPETTLHGANVRADPRGSYLRNSDIFEIVGHEGSYRSAGVGGGIVGMGYNFGIVDDPIKNREEANSPTYRRKVWDWFRSTFYTRQEGNARMLITVTRWHEDDLPGRALELAKSDSEAEQWVMITFPALAEEPLSPHDPRQIGEALWPGKYPLKKLNTFRATLGSYEWNAQYQQRPKAPEGNRFKREWFSQFVNAAPRNAKRIRYWDKGGTQDGGAYTAGVLLAQTRDGLTYVEDVVRGQWSALQREQVIKQAAELDALRYGGNAVVTNWVEQEPGSGGKESVEATIRNLTGFVVYADRPTGDKDTRMEPFAAQAEGGNVILIRGDWNAAWIEEMTAIPYGTYRDQGDATAGAFNKLHGKKTVEYRTAKVKRMQI